MPIKKKVAVDADAMVSDTVALIVARRSVSTLSSPLSIYSDNPVEADITGISTVTSDTTYTTSITVAEPAAPDRTDPRQGSQEQTATRPWQEISSVSVVEHTA